MKPAFVDLRAKEEGIIKLNRNGWMVVPLGSQTSPGFH